jgi:hypothetical protein
MELLIIITALTAAAISLRKPAACAIRIKAHNYPRRRN